MAIRNLDKLLNPRSVAIIGASNNPERLSYTVLKNLLDAGFSRPIYPVHIYENVVQGLEAYPSIDRLPETPDLAVICTPAETVPDITEECAVAGVPGVAIISAGFRETGPEGYELEQRVRNIAALNRDLRVLGPNSLGIVVPRLKFNASLATATPKSGGIAFISQSGTLGTSALDWAIQQDIGFSYFVSMGNMMDIAVGDLIDYFAADYDTKAIILYVESITEARQFMSAARAITQGKPIVVYKAGRFTESAEAAVSHTGSMSGVDEVYAAAFERAGIVRVFEIDDLFDCAQLLARVPTPSGPRLAIITNAGGPGVVATDSLMDLKGELAKLSPDTITELSAFLPHYWSHANPVDILDDATPERFGQAISVLLRDPNVDALLMILTPQSMTDPDATAHVVSKMAAKSSKPILAAWMGGKAVSGGIEVLHEAGVPTYTTPKNAVHAFMHLVSYARNRETLYETPREMPVAFPLDRDRQMKLIESIVDAEGVSVPEQASKLLLEAYGIQTTEPHLATTPDEAADLADTVGFPVVLKVVSPQIPHKLEVGGVALNIGSREDVRTAFADINDSARRLRPEAMIEGISVQPMIAAPDGFELILGCRKDPVFGAVVLVGTGGAAAEVLEDFALGLPPLNERLARRMLESLKTWPIISGQRRRPPVAVEQLVETLIRFSYLVADCPQIADMDVNPVLVTPFGVLALDARISIDRSHPSDARPFSHLAIRPYPEYLVRSSKLKDGSPVRLRPIRPEDEPRWHRMLAECSPETIRSRFRSMFHEMTHEMATRFCFIDYDRELAIVAELAEDEEKLIGVGHLVCDPDHTDADYAVLVPDAWQKRGVGALLTQTCLEIAAEWGLSEVVGETEPLNAGMLATFKRAGFELDYDTDPDIVIVRKSLIGHAADLRGAPPV